MDYEKKYKNLVAKIKNAYLYAQTDSTKAVLESIFPELAESEDKRVNEEIRNFLIDMECKREWIAYLEKQKEQKPHLELKAGKWYICHRAFCARADHLTVKEGERFQCEKDGIVKGFVIKEPEKYFKECCAPASMEDEQKEQKSAEWSEEDRKMLNTIISDGSRGVELDAKQVNWLKSLCPQYRWKPSEEQMDALLNAEGLVRANNYPENAKILALLYEQLKTL